MTEIASSGGFDFNAGLRYNTHSMKKYILNEHKGKIETHIDFKGNLNEQQYEVVTAAEGPCLVLAGAGSGKTRTLIYRLAYLLERGVPPKNILLMTFTNKAAREMRDRTEMLLKYNPKGLWSGTFHHVGNRSLRMYAEEPRISDQSVFAHTCTPANPPS